MAAEIQKSKWEVIAHKEKFTGESRQPNELK